MDSWIPTAKWLCVLVLVSVDVSAKSARVCVLRHPIISPLASPSRSYILVASAWICVSRSVRRKSFAKKRKYGENWLVALTCGCACCVLLTAAALIFGSDFSISTTIFGVLCQNSPHHTNPPHALWSPSHSSSMLRIGRPHFWLHGSVVLGVDQYYIILNGILVLSVLLHISFVWEGEKGEEEGGGE